MALLTCAKDSKELRDLVERAKPGLLSEVASQMNMTCEFFGDMISIMALACERLEITANAMGVEIQYEDA